MAASRAPLHLGGPLGAIGLGCVGGAVALVIAAMNNTPPNAGGSGDPAAILTVDEPPPHASGKPGTEADAPPSGSAGEVGELAQVEDVPRQVIERPARAEGTEVHFIVRLKGAPEVDTITRNFKRDPAAAQAAWAELVARVPAMSEFTLVGASYSGEMKLSFRMPPGESASPEDIRSVQDRILNVEGVAYADPDYVAHPGKDTPQ